MDKHEYIAKVKKMNKFYDELMNNNKIKWNKKKLAYAKLTYLPQDFYDAIEDFNDA